MKSPRYFKAQSPNNIKLSDLKLNIARNRKESGSNASAILQINEDYVIPQNQESILNSSRKSNSLNGSFNGS